jgi:hypothetical protein
MNAPTMGQLMEANPFFFEGDKHFKADVARMIVPEGDGYVLKVSTPLGTYPVYQIGPDLSLSYLRHD